MKLYKNIYLISHYFNCFARLNSLLPLLIAATLWTSQAINATNEEIEMKMIFHANRCDIDSCMGQNDRSISDIRQFINKITNDSNITLTGITICGYASPEGPAELNRKLADGRMRAMKRIVTDEYKIRTAHCICYYSISDISALIQEIELSDIEERETVLNILSDSVSICDPHTRMHRLKTTQNGRLWDSIKPLLTNLRYAKVTFSFERQVTSSGTPNIVTIPTDTVSTDIAITEDANVYEKHISSQQHDVTENKSETGLSRKPLYVSLKTNMLYDALLIPGIGAEVYLGRMTSVNAYWSYAWWRSEQKHRYWRYYGGEIAVKRWFGGYAGKPLTGHHIGLYAQILTYDFELGGKGQMGDKYNYGGGIEYGFSLPVARRLNIDFSLGVGYIGGRYHEYSPIDGHYVWQATKKRNWFGPTKAEVSLVWLIGYGNTNRMKGGTR